MFVCCAASGSRRLSLCCSLQISCLQLSAARCISQHAFSSSPFVYRAVLLLLQLCFFAHNTNQLRVTAKSLAAQQANSNSGKGKGATANKGANKASSSNNDLAAAHTTAASAGQSPSVADAAAGEQAGEPVAQLLQQLLAGQLQGGPSADLLQQLRAAGDGALDEATAAAIMHLLVQLETQEAGATTNKPADSAMLAATTATTAGKQEQQPISLGSSPGTPGEQLLRFVVPALSPQSSACFAAGTAGGPGAGMVISPAASSTSMLPGAVSLLPGDSAACSAPLQAQHSNSMWALASPAASSGAACAGMGYAGGAAAGGGLSDEELLLSPGMRALCFTSSGAGAGNCAGLSQPMLSSNMQLLPVTNMAVVSAGWGAPASSYAAPQLSVSTAGNSAGAQQPLLVSLDSGSGSSTGLPLSGASGNLTGGLSSGQCAAAAAASLSNSLMSGVSTGSNGTLADLPGMLQQQQQVVVGGGVGGAVRYGMMSYATTNTNMGASMNPAGCTAFPQIGDMAAQKQAALLLQQQQSAVVPAPAFGGIFMSPHGRGVGSMLPGSVLIGAGPMQQQQQQCFMGLSA